MKHLMSIAALGIIATSSLSPAQAQVFAPSGINGLQAQIESRINAGARSGALTRQEAFNLRLKLCRVNVMETRFRNSGSHLTSNERTILFNELTRLNREVAFQTNDRDTRYRHRRHF